MYKYYKVYSTSIARLYSLIQSYIFTHVYIIIRYIYTIYVERQVVSLEVTHEAVSGCCRTRIVLYVTLLLRDPTFPCSQRICIEEHHQQSCTSSLLMWLCNFHHLFPWNLRIFGFLQESWVIFKSNKLIRKLHPETSIIHLPHIPGPICFHVSHTKVPLTKRKFAVPPLNWCIMMPRPSTKGARHKGWGKGWGCYLWMRGGSIHGENAGTLG